MRVPSLQPHWVANWLAAVLLAILAAGGIHADDRLVVHEWGTFTALQDDDGSALSGINVDDEPLPPFVHNLSQSVLGRPNTLWKVESKGAPERHPYVTLRLETPVVYFYPPASQTEALTLDVHVDFRGGWLTQFYPQAEAIAPGLKEGNFQFGTISRATKSSLDWTGLRVGTQGNLPGTEEHVWIAPRQVRTARITAHRGESEKYLFYRGVGNFPAPLRVVSDSGTSSTQLHAQFSEVLRPSEQAQLGPLWLLEVRSDGQAAFRTLPPEQVSADQRAVLTTAPRSFAEAEFSPTNIDRLSESMRGALVAVGLYDDEASAMLATWRRAYFQSPGLRLFCIVPRIWTDHYLPLTISQSCDLERVMVARVELISPRQRALLKKLSAVQIGDLAWLAQARRSPNFPRFMAGRSDFGDLGVKIPTEYQAYLDLGRFRNALIIAEDAQRPTDALSRFIHVFGLEPYRWPKQTAAGAE